MWRWKTLSRVPECTIWVFFLFVIIFVQPYVDSLLWTIGRQPHDFRRPKLPACTAGSCCCPCTIFFLYLRLAWHECDATAYNGPEESTTLDGGGRRSHSCSCRFQRRCGPMRKWRWTGWVPRSFATHSGPPRCRRCRRYVVVPRRS